MTLCRFPLSLKLEHNTCDEFFLGVTVYLHVVVLGRTEDMLLVNVFRCAEDQEYR